MNSLYERDFYTWTVETARALRAGNVAEVDLCHLAEEVEDLGKRDRREVMNRAAVLVAHLLKWGHQPLKRSRSWHATVQTQQGKLRRVLRDSPSLRRYLGEHWDEVYTAAVLYASRDTGLAPETFPRACPFTPEQAIEGDLEP